MGGGETAPIPEPIDTNAIMQDMMGMITPMMNEMMMGMQGMVSGMMGAMSSQPPPLPNFPDIDIPEALDFEALEKELAMQARGQEAVEVARRYGADDTLHAPLLLEEPETTEEGLLAGISA